MKCTKSRLDTQLTHECLEETIHYMSLGHDQL
jgi:hypothetical protein